MKYFKCSCGRRLAFQSCRCTHCGGEVGYEPSSRRMIRLDADGPFVRCLNGKQYGVCNWVSPREGNGYCSSCALNRIIPNQGDPRNRAYWRDLELAKRRVLVNLAELGFEPESRAVRADGVAVDFLVPSPKAPVLTGHLNGVITMNVLEADADYRENLRRSFNEPQRTLPGHFRHEFGHYYWEQIFQRGRYSAPSVRQWRAVFGDEREDYAGALRRYYERGPSREWQQRHITAYASAHPWEDWAETWAIYLGIVDAVETAQQFGCAAEPSPRELKMLAAGQTDADRSFHELLESWAAFSPALDELSPQPDWPRIPLLSFNAASIHKLCFVHSTILGCASPEVMLAA